MASTSEDPRDQPAPSSGLPGGKRLRVVVFIALIAAAALLAWSNSFNASFHLDDFTSIQNNTAIRSLGNLWEILKTQEGTSIIGRPLPNLSFALNYAWGKIEPAGYHAVNLALHILAALAFFGVARRALKSSPPAPALGGSADWLAFLAALLWVAHPLQTAAVTYIVQRVEVLASLFYLFTLYAFARSLEGGEREGFWRNVSLASCLAAFASKEITVSLPLAVLLYDRAFAAGSFREAWARRKRYYLALASCWLLVIVLNIRAGTRGDSVGAVEGYTSLEYLRIQFIALTRYVKLAFWPDPLVFDYGMPKLAQLGGWELPALFVLALFALAVYALVRHPAPGFCGAVFFMVLAPTSSIIPIRDPIFEHRMYLPLAAVVMLVTAGGARLFSALGENGRRGGAALALALAVALGALTYSRNKAYADEYTLWSDTAAKTPYSARSSQNVGAYLLVEQRFAEAEPWLARSFSLLPPNSPDLPKVLLSLGISEARLGKDAKAAEHLAGAAERLPDNAESRFELGRALLRLGRGELATRYLREAAGCAQTTTEIALGIARSLRSDGYLAHAYDFAGYARMLADQKGDRARVAALDRLLAEFTGRR